MACIWIPPAGILDVILGLIAALNGTAYGFLVGVVQTEQGDGWYYIHQNYVYRHLLIPYGAWRDWGWYVGPF